MESQRINFYLTEYQLARALTTIRFLDPTYKPETIHQMIKTICIDYCAKFNIGRSDTIPPEIWPELRKILPATRPKPLKSSDNELAETLQALANNFTPSTNQPPIQPITTQPTKPKPSPELKPLTKTALLNHLQKEQLSNPLTEDQPTDSTINTVDDFSFLNSLSEGDFE